jgi:hypothetical protein
VKGQALRFVCGHVGRLRKPVPTALRFWPRVNKTDDCWLWTGRVNKKGYGVFDRREAGERRSYARLAHRIAWELTHGPILNLSVLHRCDNPPCVRPDHLFLGTNDDNMKDASSKGRLSTAARVEAGRQNIIKATAKWLANWHAKDKTVAYALAKQKNRARKFLEQKRRSGRVTAQPCEVCGATRVEAHHIDYSRPLDVSWLCRAHHLEHHSRG